MAPPSMRSGTPASARSSSSSPVHADLVEPTNVAIGDQIQQFKEHVDRQLQSIQEQSDRNTQALLSAIQAIKPSQPKHLQTSIIIPVRSIKLPELPLKSGHEVNLLNVQLMDNAFAEQMILKLNAFRRPANSNNVRVRFLMERIIPYELAVKYSWTGRGGITDNLLTKLSFGDKHKIHDLVVRTLQYRNPNIVDEKETIVAIQEYFKRSKIRLDRVSNKHI